MACECRNFTETDAKGGWWACGYTCVECVELGFQYASELLERKNQHVVALSRQMTLPLEVNRVVEVPSPSSPEGLPPSA